MANEKFTQLPTVTNSMLGDIIAAVQGGVSTQQTLQQVLSLSLAQTILSFAGNPNGNVAGVIYQFCWDITDTTLYICTTSGNATTAVWTVVANSASSLVTPARGGTGIVNPTAHAIAIAEGSSNFDFLTLTNGQVLIGSTGLDPVPANIIAGAGVTIVNTAGGISISASGSGPFSWTHVTGTSQSMSTNSGYLPDNVGLVTLTMPTVAALGDELDIIGIGSGGWLIAQNANQIIHVGSATTTTGAGGSVASTNRRDTITMVCTVANLEWTAYSVMGNLTIV